MKEEVKNDEDAELSEKEWPHKATLALIDVLTERKVDNKAYKNLG